MKEEFLVIDHNDILRILFLKCNTLLKLKEYSYKKNIKEILKENDKVNTIIDAKCNNIKTEDIENKIEEKTNKKDIEEVKNEIFSPRNNLNKTDNKTDNNMVTIELNEPKDIIIDVKNNEEKKEEIKELDEIRELEEQHEANGKCASGCNFCMNGCDLICTGVGYICQCFNYYMGRLYRKIKKMF